MPIANVIQYEGDNKTFIFRHPCTDFNLGSQLIVHESQEAIFLKNGQALDTFGPGRHTLSTQNIPLIRKLFAKAMDGEMFHCEVYFINKTEQLAIKWGLDSQVEFTVPNYQFPLKLGASGEMSLSVEDGRRIVIKLVGTETTLTQDQFINWIRGQIKPVVAAHLARKMRSGDIGIFDVDAYMDVLSTELQAKLLLLFADYGFALDRFVITRFVKPEEDPCFKQLKDLYFRNFGDIADAEIRQKREIIEQKTSAEKMRIEAQGLADKRRIEGYNKQWEDAVQIAMSVAKNEGTGNMASTGFGLGMMGGIAGGAGPIIAGVVGSALSPLQGGSQLDNNRIDTIVGVGIPNEVQLKSEASVTPESKPSSTNGGGDIVARLGKLDGLKAKNLITEEEYQTRRSRILDEI